MLTPEDFAVVRKKSPQVFRLETYWYIDAQVRILQCVKNLLGCCLNHCTTIFCMLFSDTNIQP